MQVEGHFNEFDITTTATNTFDNTKFGVSGDTVLLWDDVEMIVNLEMAQQ